MNAAPPSPGKRPSDQPHPLLDHLDALIAQLRGHVPLALREFDATAIHQARVATRRLGAAFDILEPLVSAGDLKDLRKALRKLRRRLGPHRDLDVLIEHVDEMAAEEPFTLAAAFVSRTLRRRRDKLRREALDQGRVHRTLMRLGGYDTLRDELLTHHGAMASLVAEGVHASADEFSALADLLSHHELERDAAPVAADPSTRPPAYPTGGAIDPHDLRIAGKHLRYSLELADAGGTPGMAPLLKTFKQLQDALGLWHDFVVLADTALGAVAEAELTHRDSALAAKVLALASEALRRAAQHLGVFAALWSERGAKLAHAIREALPLTKPAPTPHPDEWPRQSSAQSANARVKKKKSSRAIPSQRRDEAVSQSDLPEAHVSPVEQRGSEHAGSDSGDGATAPLENPQ